MKLLTKALTLSLLAHAAVSGGVMLAASYQRSPAKPVYVDFFMESQFQSESGSQPSKGENAYVHNNEVFHKKIDQKTRFSDAKPKVTKNIAEYRKKCTVSANRTCIGKTRSSAKEISNDSGCGTKNNIENSIGMAGEPSKSGSPGVLERYMLEHFAYIRDLIRKNLRYPRAAVSMGLTGKAGVSFMVLENGEIDDLEVVRSSGARILDIDAIETVRRAAPFPPPHVVARIVIPVEYILE